MDKDIKGSNAVDILENGSVGLLDRQGGVEVLGLKDFLGVVQGVRNVKPIQCSTEEYGFFYIIAVEGVKLEGNASGGGLSLEGV